MQADRDKLQEEVLALRQQLIGEDLPTVEKLARADGKGIEFQSWGTPKAAVTENSIHPPNRLMEKSGRILSQQVYSTPSHLPNDATSIVQEGSWRQMYSEASGEVQKLQKELLLVQRELEDERHVHELRSLADGARKLEIQELQAVQGRADLNIEYLKNVLVGFFESGELPLNRQVLICLDRLMLFTPQDRARIWKTEEHGQKGWISRFFQ